MLEAEREIAERLLREQVPLQRLPHTTPTPIPFVPSRRFSFKRPVLRDPPPDVLPVGLPTIQRLAVEQACPIATDCIHRQTAFFQLPHANGCAATAGDDGAAVAGDGQLVRKRRLVFARSCVGRDGNLGDLAGLGIADDQLPR